MRELDATSAYLTTGSEDLAAVQLYLGLGFRPEVRGQEELDAWRGVRVALERRFKTLLQLCPAPVPARGRHRPSRAMIRSP